MFGALTDGELSILQDMLYDGTEDVFSFSDLGYDNLDWVCCYRPLHSEIAQLFLEAASELRNRLHQQNRELQIHAA